MAGVQRHRLTLASLDLPQFLSCGMLGDASPLPALIPHPAHLFPQMKFSLEKLHQGITISDPPFDSQPRSDDSFS